MARSPVSNPSIEFIDRNAAQSVAADVPRGPATLFGAAVFMAAFLLFAVEPLIARFVLPWFGGSPGVWTTCMLFFQVMLLAGYAYARWSIQRLTPRAQALVHMALFAGSLAFLPVIPSATWKPAPGQDPTLRLILLLACTVGPPFFVLAGSGPLLQAWLARAAGRAPYRLFALSNFASLLALVLYPLVAEPWMTRRTQAVLWSVGLVACVAVCGAVAWIVLRAWQKSVGIPGEAISRPSSLHRMLWLLLPCFASGLLLAVTNSLCQDVAVVPFLWIVPLAIYLLSFVVAFDSPRWYRRRPTAAVLLLCIALLCLINLRHGIGLFTQALIYSTCLFAACLICHGELARLKPPTALLGSYYLSLSAGGALGGVFVAIAAPLLFNTFLELHLFLLACTILLVFFVWQEGRFRRNKWMLAGPFLALIFLLTAVSPPATMRVIAKSRNFYGTLRVVLTHDEEQKPVMEFFHGRILHGVQYTDPAAQREPTAYFRPTSGAGVIFRNFLPAGGRRIGVVGLGAGTLAAYGRPGDYFRFYEINPDVIRIARTYFTFLTDCVSKTDIIPGDGRLSLERDSPQRFDILVLDAFSGDSIPTHLLTTQAFDLYRRHLNSNGVLAVQVTNVYLNLAPLVARLGAQLNLHAIEFEDNYSSWVLLTDNNAFLACSDVRAGSQTVKPDASSRVWTDDYCNLLHTLRR